MAFRKSGLLALAVAATVVVPAIVVGSGSAFASSRSTKITEATWQRSIAQTATPGRGCYHASYPSLAWHPTRCKEAPKIPLVPQTVGDGTDYSAVTTGLISETTGTFPKVGPKTITESGKVGGDGKKRANTFTLQLNSQFFASPTCKKAATPSKCEGWQQFVYETSSNSVFMQYWLLYYDTTCPSSWTTYIDGGSIFCYTNSPSSTYPGSSLTAAQLADVTLVGKATASGADQVSMSVSGGQATAASNADSEVDLAGYWNTSEFNVFGDGGGSAAKFGADSTIEVQTALVSTSKSAPSCVDEGFTAETNNLNLTKAPVLGTDGSPTILAKQTNKTAKTPSCSTAAG